MLIAQSLSDRIRFPNWLKISLIGLLILGVIFRFVNLNHKVYWHDEVYTSIRAASYTRGEIDDQLFQNRLILAKDLQQYQRIKPGSSAADTVQSLIEEDPQHPPFYFVLTRFWIQAFDGVLSSAFHSPLTTVRSLPVLFGVLAVPAMYVLAWELFASPSVALLAATFLALSPFDVLFAQTARQYSLLTLMVIASSALLLRAMRHSKPSNSQYRHTKKTVADWANWGGYGLTVVIGLYTHPFFGLTLAAHCVYLHSVLFLEPLPRPQQRHILLGFWVALGAALILYSPWIFMMMDHRQRALATTNWAQVFPGFDYLLKLWILSFSSLFFDLDFGFDNPWNFVARLPFLVLTGVAFYVLCQQTKLPTWLFVVISFAVPFLLLALPDLVLGGKYSAVSRYLIACYPPIQLAVAYFLSARLALKPAYRRRSPTTSRRSRSYTLQSMSYTILHIWLWRGILGVVMLACLISLTTSALANSWWNKDLSYFNNQTADIINQTESPLVISDIGDDFTNTGDLISLSYRLKPEVRLLLLQNDQPAIIETEEFRLALQGSTAIAFRPSHVMRQKLEQTYGRLLPLLQGEMLWKVPGDRLLK